MALDTFVAGAYTATYNAVAVGLTRSGFTLAATPKYERINESDLYGETLIDGVFRGADCTLEWVSRAYKAGSVSPFWPFGNTFTAGDLGVIATPTVPISSLMSDLAKAVVLTAVANTPAHIVGTATPKAGPLTLTAPKATLAPDFDARLLFDSKLREVPIKLQLLPVLSTGQAGEPTSGSIYHHIRT